MGKKKKSTDRLLDVMKDRKLRQADVIRLAEPYCKKYGLKLTKPDMSQYCSGKVEPAQDKLYILASALDVSIPWLMGLDVPFEHFTMRKSESITERESRHLEDYRKLSNTGKDRADEYIKNLIAVEKLEDDADVIKMFQEEMIAARNGHNISDEDAKMIFELINGDKKKGNKNVRKGNP